MSLHPLPAIIPKPRCVTLNEGILALPLSAKTCIEAAGAAVSAGEFLARRLRAGTGYPFRLVAGEGAGADGSAARIRFEIIPALESRVGREGYLLDAGESGATLQAADPAGLFYACQSFLQLLPPAIFDNGPRPDITWSLPAVSIEDRPAFGWRGAMLDVGRSFMPVEFIKKFLDL